MYSHVFIRIEVFSRVIRNHRPRPTVAVYDSPCSQPASPTENLKKSYLHVEVVLLLLQDRAVDLVRLGRRRRVLVLLLVVRLRRRLLSEVLELLVDGLGQRDPQVRRQMVQVRR